MSNKLTREEWVGWYRNNSWSEQWQAIAAHTAECVAEAVAEAIKNRYEVGEIVQAVVRDGSSRWVDAVVTARELNGIRNNSDPDYVRRHPRTRPMSDVELYMKVIEVTGKDLKLSRPTLEAMARDLGIALEVEE